ncbi:MAG TPA: Ig-like domain-containing protein [Candidatus Choladousia intestinigallinarum]|nr:Ig-like domain-containing protein [Candidatus Choladousia intestinigallinarum]
MKWKKRNICRWLMMFALVLTVSLIPAQKNEAASYGLSLNNAWVSHTITTKGDVNFYSFSIPSAGTVTIDYQGWSIRDSYVQVMDADQTVQFAKHEVYYSSNVDPKTKNITLALEPGAYCVKVWGYGSNVGDYRLKASFQAAGNTERESNNAFNTAMPLNANSQVIGFLSMNDDVDFYSFYVPYSQTVRITYTGMIRDSYCELWNKDFQSIKKQNVYYGSEDAPKTYVYEGDLTPGTYYLKIYPYGSNTGRYRLKWESAQVIVNVSNITINGAKSLKRGQTLALSASVLPSNATNKNVTWYSSNTSVASVDSSGKVTANGVGTTTITATAADGSKVSKSCTISVTEPTLKVSSIIIRGAKSLKKGQSLTLTATVSPSNATNKKVTWRSSNNSVATVSSSGKVTAKGAGTARITATAADGSKVSKSCTIKVTDTKVTSVSISGNKRITVGSKLQLKVKVLPTNAANRNVTWTSSNKSVATVTSSGKVTAKRPGRTVITAKAKDGSGKKKSIYVIVIPKKMAASTVTSPAQKKIRVTLKRQTGVSGYQVQYAKNNKFKSAKVYNASKNAKSVTISKLTSKKTYYVRTRSYIKIGSKKYYGAWSVGRRIKVK